MISRSSSRLRVQRITNPSNHGPLGQGVRGICRVVERGRALGGWWRGRLRVPPARLCGPAPDRPSAGCGTASTPSSGPPARRKRERSPPQTAPPITLSILHTNTLHSGCACTWDRPLNVCISMDTCAPRRRLHHQSISQIHCAHTLHWPPEFAMRGFKTAQAQAFVCQLGLPVVEAK